MINIELAKAIVDFSSLLLPVSENDLRRNWTWKGHDGEGIRFAFFVTIQELRQLAVALAAGRKPVTQAQHILGQYHKQYLDLQSAVFRLSKEDADRPPSESEWPVRQVYGHMLNAEIYFSAAIHYALEHHRAGTWTSDRMTDEDETRLIGMSDEELTKLTSGPLDGMLTYHRGFHLELIQEFSSLTDKELDLPSVFWEKIHFPIRHRLHRYEAHLIQHTVQIDKTLTAIGKTPTETNRLIRHVFAALAEVDAILIGEEGPHNECLQLAMEINSRTTEIREILQST